MRTNAYRPERMEWTFGILEDDAKQFQDMADEVKGV